MMLNVEIALKEYLINLLQIFDMVSDYVQYLNNINIKSIDLNKKPFNQKLVKTLESISTIDSRLISFKPKKKKKHSKDDTYVFH